MPLFHPLMRLDRLLTLGLVHPAIRVGARPGGRRVPILMYHGIRDGLGNRAPYFETNTSPAVFAAHVRFLRQNRYTAITLSQAMDYACGTVEFDSPVAITFDDGFTDFYTHALPVLAANSFTATMFIVSDLVGTKPACFPDRECMKWSEIREIQSAGIEIGSHTVSHPVLHRLCGAGLNRELQNSKVAIEDHLGCSVNSFSYPYAFPEHDKPFVQTLRSLLAECGYRNGVSTIIGTAGHSDDRFFLPRLPINSHDDLKLLRAKLDGAYDWLHIAQLSYKSLIKRMSGATTLDSDAVRRGVTQ